MKTHVWNTLLSLVLCAGLLSSAAMAEDTPPAGTGSADTTALTETEPLTIFYTNDVHTYIDGALTYSRIAALKDAHPNALLLDAGDHIQGTAYGSMDQGQTIIALMNAAGYDAATLGNHEFDYGMSGCMQAIAWADYPYLSCNFYHEHDGIAGETVLDSYQMFDINGTDVAVIGITTPESITSSTPAYFQDENGNYVYGIAAGADGEALYDAVQTAIDAAEEEGADYIIALGHLGNDLSSAPYRSVDVIENTVGLDVFIDGHSHSTIPMEEISDKNDNTVILTQTGSYLNTVGMLTIDSAGTITTELLTADDLTAIPLDADVGAIEDNWITSISESLGTKIGFAAITLDNYSEDGSRLVRKQETNSGDFAADALYYLFDDMGLDVDLAVMNGGGVRNQAITGDLTYKLCKDIHTFGNVACLQSVTGQQILDMLEWGARHVGESEDGSFLHVSGVTYQINTAIANTTKADDKDVWIGGPTEYRVSNVKIYNKETNTWDALELDTNYQLAGYNYTLRDLGGGFAMLNDAVNVLDYVMEDYMVLANYINGFENGIVEADNSPLSAKYPGFTVDYGTVSGSGRIVINHGNAFTDVSAADWFYEDVEYVRNAGLMVGTNEDGTVFSPASTASRAMITAILWRLEGEPATDDAAVFSDVPKDAWYTAAVNWASANGIVLGYGDGTFGPQDDITREQIAAIFQRYMVYRGLDDGLTLPMLPPYFYSLWAENSVIFAYRTGLFDGLGVDISDLTQAASRAEIAAYLRRFCETNIK